MTAYTDYLHPQSALSALLLGQGQPQTGLGSFLAGAQSPADMVVNRGPTSTWEPGGQSPGPIGPGTPTPAKKPGFFGKGGTGWGIAGILADALAGAGGHEGGYAPMVAKRQQDEADQRSALEQILLRRQLEQQFPTPSEFEKGFEYYQKLTPDQQKSAMDYRMATAPRFGIDPSTGAYGQFGVPTAAPAGPAAGAIVGGYRFKGGNPNDQGSWEPVGGSTVTPSTGFR